MKEIRVTETSDGKLHKDGTQAAKHQKLLDLSSEAKRLLVPEALDTSDFWNGKGFIKLTEAKMAEFTSIFREAMQLHGDEMLAMFIKNPRGIVGRYLCDGDSPAYSMWCLLSQVDSNLRLWGQPYYAIHGGEMNELVEVG